jgi:hypothetical protein
MFSSTQRNSPSLLHAAYGKPTPTQIPSVLLGLQRRNVLEKEQEVEGEASGVG